MWDSRPVLCRDHRVVCSNRGGVGGNHLAWNLDDGQRLAGADNGRGQSTINWWGHHYTWNGDYLASGLLTVLFEPTSHPTPLFAHGMPDGSLLLLLFGGTVGVPIAVAAVLAAVGRALSRKRSPRWGTVFQFVTLLVIAGPAVWWAGYFALDSGTADSREEHLGAGAALGVLIVSEILLWWWLQPKTQP